ncbi:phage holin family protein [Sphingomonas arenae]|uniref:phage holin family protein n=1 Tax=Sphingomonas arenae TaxID=2812555 RepID=UPI001968450B|nr:phage holin family protein [Sphingomonas arenae]
MATVTVTATGPAPAGDPMLKRTESVQGEPEGVGDLLHRLVEDGKAYARAEVNYYKTVGTERASALKLPVIFGVLALLFVHAAFLALCATLFVGLASLMSDTLAGLLTVLILAGVGGVLGYLAYSKGRAAFGGQS